MSRMTRIIRILKHVETACWTLTVGSVVALLVIVAWSHHVG